MSKEKISCRIAIQVCVGHFPDGRERHRTFSLRHVRPDVSMEAIRDLIRALVSVMAYPITKVTKVTKTEWFFDEDAAAVPSPQVDIEPRVDAGQVPEEVRIIPFPIFPVTERPAVHRAIAYRIAKASSNASLRRKCFMAERAPPARSRPESKQSRSLSRGARTGIL